MSDRDHGHSGRARAPGSRPAQRRSAGDRARLAWWLVAIAPLIVGLLAYAADSLRVGGLWPGVDVSELAMRVAGWVAIGVGVTMAVGAIRRARGAVRSRIRHPGDRLRSELLQEAWEVRLRSGWLILVGIGLIAAGFVLAVFAAR